ncbi:siderophore-interacting protein [Nocardiopsis algeriensis]|uniref:siderophore-interacting protein n=1 Tax=Nocardiopsis algeriensis TaxID=1478215 RepID=UPI003B434958
MSERSGRPGRRAPQVTHARVERVERLTPHMVRLVLGGPGMAEFTAGEYTDHYIKLLFPPEGAPYSVPFDLGKIREELPRELWPAMRTYTVRGWDAERKELLVDVVTHGDEGLAGVWAAGAKPGDEICFVGPGGAYAPDPEADWHLLVGDESALPAVAAALERLPQGAVAHVFLEVAGPEEEQELVTAANAAITWIHRGAGAPGAGLVGAVEALDFPEGDVHAFVHGEAGAVKELRRVLLRERGVPRERVSISGYWRLGMNEDGWQAGKREWNRQVEEEQDKA